MLDDGRYRAALAAGQPGPPPLFARLDGDDVVWGDGDARTGRRDHPRHRLPPRPRLPGRTGALDADGRPLHRAGVSTTVRGLGYVGLEYQRSIASATVRGVGRDAQHVTAGSSHSAATPPLHGR